MCHSCGSTRVKQVLLQYHRRASQTAGVPFQGARKVRAPQGKMPANGWAGRPDGSVPQKRRLPCSEHAAMRSMRDTGEKLKRCGKSAPARRQRRGLVNPIWSKRK